MSKEDDRNVICTYIFAQKYNTCHNLFQKGWLMDRAVEKTTELFHLSARCNFFLRNGLGCICNTAKEYHREKLCLVPKAPSESGFAGVGWSGGKVLLF
jgi:hypothetical protein